MVFANLYIFGQVVLCHCNLAQLGELLELDKLVFLRIFCLDFESRVDNLLNSVIRHFANQDGYDAVLQDRLVPAIVHSVALLQHQVAILGELDHETWPHVAESVWDFVGGNFPQLYFEFLDFVVLDDCQVHEEHIIEICPVAQDEVVAAGFGDRQGPTPFVGAVLYCQLVVGQAALGGRGVLLKQQE